MEQIRNMRTVYIYIEEIFLYVPVYCTLRQKNNCFHVFFWHIQDIRNFDLRLKENPVKETSPSINPQKGKNFNKVLYICRNIK